VTGAYRCSGRGGREISSCTPLGETRERYRFLLAGYVVLPNHVHLLTSESPNGTASVVLKVLKQRFSGSTDSTTPMSGVKRKFARRSTTFVRTRLAES
jgi:REP element-mobilizing transposase RayT